MGNKFDILHEYQLAEQKCAELTNVCEKLHGTKRGSHLVAVYDAKLKDTKRPPGSSRCDLKSNGCC